MIADGPCCVTIQREKRRWCGTGWRWRTGIGDWGVRGAAINSKLKVLSVFRRGASMKRTINFRLLGILMLAMALVSAAAYGFHEFQVHRRADALLREAKSA